MKYIVLSCAILAGASMLLGAGGAADDPLVTKSWVDDYIESSFLKMEKEIAQTKANLGSSYNIKLWIGNKQAQVGGKTVNLDVAPVIKDGRTMVPLAFVSQSLGASVNWDNTKKEVSYKKGNTKVRMIVGQKSATVNDKTVSIDAPVYVENGRTMVPLAFIANALSAKTQWDNTTKMITIR